MKTLSHRILASALLLWLGIGSVVDQSSAAVITEPFDTFPGSAADPGWLGGWSTSSTVGTISNTNPVNGGGNYLSVTTNPGAGDRAISRRLDPAVLNTANTPYTISWDVRFDALGDFSSYTDRIHFTANQGGNVGSDASASWLIGVVGGNNSGDGNYFVGNWYFYDNPSSTADGTFTGTSMVDTKIALVEGHTYSFVVEVNPLSRTYSATITDLTTSASFHQPNMRFRNQGVGDSHQYLVVGNPQSAVGETRTFSIDNFNIVPEPGRVFLCSSALGLALLRRHRRRDR